MWKKGTFPGMAGFSASTGDVEKEGGYQRLLSKALLSTGMFSFSTRIVEIEYPKKGRILEENHP